MRDIAAAPLNYNGTLVSVPVLAFGPGDDTATVATTTEGFGDDSGTIIAGGPFAAIIIL